MEFSGVVRITPPWPTATNWLPVQTTELSVFLVGKGLLTVHSVWANRPDIMPKSRVMKRIGLLLRIMEDLLKGGDPI